MISAKDLRPGTVIIYNGAMHEVVEALFHKPGKGGSMMKTKMRNLSSGSMMQETLRSEDLFEEVHIEQHPMQYLYKDAHGYCFMDETTYEQTHASESVVGDAADYLKENMIVTANIHDGHIMRVTPPIHVVLRIVTTDPGFRGNTVTGATKPATTETGKIVKVPLFIETGELIKIDTRTGEYVERA